MAVKYCVPPELGISPQCMDLLSRIFLTNPQDRISIADIRKHPWFLLNLPAELAVRGGQGEDVFMGCAVLCCGVFLWCGAPEFVL